MKKTQIHFIFTLLFLVTSLYGIDRRRDQYNYNPGYLIVPAPYSIPGIGEGVAILGMANNINNTQTDLIGDIILGDVEGYGIGIKDFYLIDKHLQFDIFQEGLKKANMQSFFTRGMNSSKDDFLNVSVDDLQFTAFRATSSYLEKMVEFYFTYYTNEYKLKSLKDKDNNLITDTSSADKQGFDIYTIGFMLDFTDDRIDPRVGLRYDFGIDYSPNSNSKTADYYITNHNLTAYVPVGDQNTWAFNYFRSDAHMISKGETDFSAIESSYGLDCSSLSGSNKVACENLINSQIASNKYGNATSLGGRTRLRSYPEGRFNGAHSQFYGTEFRWNITKENTPFDIWFMKDIRTSIQTAFFYERGSVSDFVDNLGKNEKQSYGAGLRIAAGSGLIYRFDVAMGDEDFEYTVIINYPWEQF